MVEQNGNKSEKMCFCIYTSYLMPATRETYPTSFRNLVMRFAETHSIYITAHHFGISHGTVSNWKRLERSTGSLNPRPRAGGRPRRLSERQVARIFRHLELNPTSTNAELAQVVGNIISPRTVTEILRRSDPIWTWKKTTPEEPEESSPEIVEQTRRTLDRIRRIPLARRVYQDESYVKGNTQRNRGRARRGRRIHQSRWRWSKTKITIIQAIRQDGVVHPVFVTRTSATNEVFVDYVKTVLAPCLRRGDVVIWDSLGKRSGRSQHYSPEARRLIEAKGAKLLILPGHEALLNPIELYWNVLKRGVQGSYHRSRAGVQKRERTVNELRRACRAAERRIPASSFAGFFRERANGREWKRKYLPNSQ